MADSKQAARAMLAILKDPHIDMIQAAMPWCKGYNDEERRGHAYIAITEMIDAIIRNASIIDSMGRALSEALEPASC